jgi:hypothetical protein
MAQGFPSQSPEPMAPFAVPIKDLLDRVRRLETPTGTSMTNLVAQVQAALVGIDQKVQDSIAANSYTKAQIDSKIANPGNISPGSVSASGNISAAGTVTAGGLTVTGNTGTNGTTYSGGTVISPGSHNFNVTSGYVACWINGDGTFGTSASTRRVKRDLVPMRSNVADAILSLVPQWGHFIWDEEDPDALPKSFLIAEDVDDLGLFGEDVLVRDDDGLPLSLNYSQLVPALIATVQQLHARITALESPAAAA